MLEEESLFQEKIHIHIHQRNGRKCQTLVEGLADDLDHKRICRTWRKLFSANGSISTEDDKTVIMMQGDQRENIKQWLIENSIITEENIVIHG